MNLREAFQLLVVHQVHVLRADRFEVEGYLAVDSAGVSTELAVLPVPRRGGDFADVDLGVEVGGEGLAVIAAVAIEDVERADGLAACAS